MTNEVIAPIENSAQTQNVNPEIYTKGDMERVRQEASDKAFRAGYGKAKEELTPKQEPAAVANQYNQPMPQVQQQNMITPEMQQKIAQDAAQEMLKQQQAAEAHKAVQEVDLELDQKKDKFPDLENVLKNANFNLYPHAVGLISDRSISNRAELAYHLANNPSKKAFINDLAARGDYSGAIKETRRIADSLMQNETAAQMPQTREPLSQLTPSTGNVSSGGPKTVADYRNNPAYKF